MELINHDPGVFIEELVFQIVPGLVDRYIELEYQIMAQELAKLPGFEGWQIWESQTHPGEVTSLYFWKDYESYKNMNQTWLFQKKDEITKAFGADNFKFVRVGHEENKRFLRRRLQK